MFHKVLLCCALPLWLCGSCSAFTDLDALEVEPEGSQCERGQGRCDGVCTPVGTVLRCGGCSPCVPGAGSAVDECTEGVCVFVCEGAAVDVNGDLSSGSGGDGCECTPTQEFCNGVDDDCDGEVDEGLEDNGCGGCVSLGSRPGAACAECGSFVCEGRDALRCDDTPPVFFRDQDGDGFGTDEFVSSCVPEPPFTALRSGDCADGNRCINPEAQETCDRLDNDCDEAIDGDDDDMLVPDSERCLTEGVCAGTLVQCLSGGFVCDYDAMLYERGEGSCDGRDNDCDGEVDEGVLTRFFADVDEDNFGDDEVFVDLCEAPDGYVEVDGDCQDRQTLINPDAVELCDGIDDDCDEDVDENAIGAGEDCTLVRCGRGQTVCEQGQVRCEPTSKRLGFQETVPVETQLVYAVTGTATPLGQDSSILISSDGQKIYNVAYGIDGEQYAGWTVKVFTPGADGLAFEGQYTIPTPINESPFFGVAAISPQEILTFNFAGNLGGVGAVWSLNLDDLRAEVFFEWSDRETGEASAEYDWTRGHLWTISLTETPARAFRYEDPFDLTEFTQFRLDEPSGSDNIIASDGRHIYSADYSFESSAPRTPLRRSPLLSDNDEIVSSVVRIMRPVASITYHSDGYLYSPVQSDPSVILRFAVTVGGLDEVCDGIDNDCDGLVDNIPECE